MSSIAPLPKGKRAEEWLNGVNIDALERHPMISPLEKGLVEGDHGKRLWEKWAVKYARPSEGMVVLDRGFGGPRGGDNIPTIGVIYNFKHDEYGRDNEYQNDNPWLKKCSILYELAVDRAYNRIGRSMQYMQNLTLKNKNIFTCGISIKY